MQLTPAGAIAAVLWHEIKNHAKNIELGEFVVMPNHIHGILILKRGETNDVVGTTQNDVGATQNDGLVGTTQNDVGATQNDGLVGTTHALSLSDDPALPLLPSSSRFQNQGKNTISSIVGSYKSAVTKYCNLLDLTMGWQSRFHDHIIRDDDSFLRISQYIRNNPSKWNEDLFY